MTAARTSDGEYIAKQITIALPPGANGQSSGIARFAYRGWAAGVQEPVRFAVCNIPNTAASRERFAHLFDASVVSVAQLQARGRAAGTSDAKEWQPGLPASALGTTPTYLVDGMVTDPHANKLAGDGITITPYTACGPTAFQCDDGTPNDCLNDPTLDGCQPDAGGGGGGGGGGYTTDPFCDVYAPVPDPGCSGVPEDTIDPAVLPADDLGTGSVLTPSADGATLSLGASPSTAWWQCDIWSYAPYHYQYSDAIAATHVGICNGAINYFRVHGYIEKRKSYFFGLIVFWSVKGQTDPMSSIYGPGTQTVYTAAQCSSGGSGIWRGRTNLLVSAGTDLKIADGYSPSRYYICTIW